MNVLSEQKRTTIFTLLQRGLSQREVAKALAVHRATVRRCALELSKCTTLATGILLRNGRVLESASDQNRSYSAVINECHEAVDARCKVQTVPPWPPAFVGQKGCKSACEPYRTWITEQIGLGRNAVAIYQDLVEQQAYSGRYNSVKRFVRKLKKREPERFDVLEFAPGEEAQVDYGQGALTLWKNGIYKRPYLFVMTLKFSGKSFRKVLWKTSQEAWAKLHEDAFRAFGGCCRYVVLDNLKEGVIKPDLYEPELNRVYAAMLMHYGVVAQPCRVRDPNRKGSVERAVQHTQDTALKGKKFESIEAQNEWLAHWEERWAAPRIHGRKKRQVIEMYQEEKPFLLPLPASGFRCFVEEERKVDDAGLIQVKGSYYSAVPADLYTPVKVRIYADEIVILQKDGSILRRHPIATRRGAFAIPKEDRIFNPSLETAKLLERIEKIGPKVLELAKDIFASQGRAAHGLIYGLSNLTKLYGKDDIEAACMAASKRGRLSFKAIKDILERKTKTKREHHPDLMQQASDIRPISDYQQFWDLNAQTNTKEEKTDGYVHD